MLSTVNVWYCYLSQVVEVTLSVLSTVNVWYCYLSQVVEVTLSVLSTVNVWYCYLSQVVEVTLSVLSTVNVWYCYLSQVVEAATTPPPATSTASATTTSASTEVPLPSTETPGIQADLTVAVFSSSGSPLVNTTILVYNNNQTTFLSTSPDSNVVQINETILREEWLGVVATKQGYATNGFVWQSGDATSK